jgi:hypothetical protein
MFILLNNYIKKNCFIIHGLLLNIAVLPIELTHDFFIDYELNVDLLELQQ